MICGTNFVCRFLCVILDHVYYFKDYYDENAYCIRQVNNCYMRDGNQFKKMLTTHKNQTNSIIEIYTRIVHQYYSVIKKV